MAEEPQRQETSMKWMRQAALRRFLQGGACAVLLSVFNMADAATLQAVANNNFVSATAAGTSYLTATAPTASTWEQFEIVNNANGTISLKATISRNFVAADTGLAAPNTNKLIANRQAIGG